MAVESAEHSWGYVVCWPTTPRARRLRSQAWSSQASRSHLTDSLLTPVDDFRHPAPTPVSPQLPNVFALRMFPIVQKGFISPASGRHPEWNGTCPKAEASMPRRPGSQGRFRTKRIAGLTPLRQWAKRTNKFGATGNQQNAGRTTVGQMNRLASPRRPIFPPWSWAPRRDLKAPLLPIG
jgi:hypothetical protein